tara:strand:+ start:128 stop:382 length:255 start_codon:yes stop_codon:yes gene_type:complete
VKKVILFSFLLFLNISYSQKIYSTDYSSQSDIKIFVVDYESQADLKVFKVNYESQATGNEGLWYFVKYKSQAGWKNKSKKFLLY